IARITPPDAGTKHLEAKILQLRHVTIIHEAGAGRSSSYERSRPAPALVRIVHRRRQDRIGAFALRKEASRAIILLSCILVICGASLNDALFYHRKDKR